ncbi:universal stress family protein [Pseudarthrobacter siccitolerans]|uniref:Universal stress family protein n=1 Tax=Pseudarthrobacter siccitolerans TaxID=861266 RepID=A0A024H249_9MICC|nr:universal stress protein [Pseudarthrobacter siccitolerans]CCQ46068.1 universal stress family protein [Pseudarthrobacter siccitolerans]
MNDSKTVVAGYDGSVEAAQAVRWAATQACRRNARLLLVHCSLWPLVTTDLGPVPGVADSGLERSAQITLEEGLAHARHAEPDLNIQTELPYGWPTAHLVKLSAGKELLVVGSRGLGGFMGLLVGSVSLELAATAACPVAVIRSNDHPEGPVIVAVDESGSPTALEDACTMAASAQTSLTIIHVQHTPAGYRQVREPLDAHSAAQEVLQTALKTARSLAPAVSVQRKLLTDTSIPRAIIRASGSAQIIVVGTKGHGVVRGTIGSTAHAVLHHSHGPVLVSRRTTMPHSTQEQHNSDSSTAKTVTSPGDLP